MQGRVKWCHVQREAHWELQLLPSPCDLLTGVTAVLLLSAGLFVGQKSAVFLITTSCTGLVLATVTFFSTQKLTSCVDVCVYKK